LSVLLVFLLVLTGNTLSFGFIGLVVASCLYSLPFVIPPLQNAFESIDQQPLEAAWSLGAKPVDAFFSVIFPLTMKGYITAAVLGLPTH